MNDPSNSRTTATLIAPAKLTLSLRVTGVRSDGYHLIDAEMVTLSLHDTLTITSTGQPGPSTRTEMASNSRHQARSRTELAAGTRSVQQTAETGQPFADQNEPRGRPNASLPTLTASGPYSSGMPLDHTNLIIRSLRLANRSANVHVDKQIPHGGGLGGGSADAAAVLRWAGYTDLAGAATIGADVPFCLVGGRARVRGIGELIEPLPFVERAFTLVIPPLYVSTPAVYAAWDAMGAPTARGVNDLEPAAIEVEPRLAWWRETIGNATGQTPVLAGSGATWFVEGVHDNALAAVSNEGAEVVVVTTTPGAANGP